MLKLKKYQQYFLGLIASLGLLLIGAAILAISLFSANRQQAASIQQISSELITAYTNPTEETAPAQATQPTYLVTDVIDGDTIKLETGETVRYLGIDAPETVGSKKGTQCYGQQAADYNRQLVENQSVTLEKDVSQTDQFGRLLRYVYLDDLMINQKLIQEGYALISTYPPDIKYQELFLTAQQQARENNLGLWANCPVTSPEPAKD